MALETELKLRISPESLNRLRRHPLLRSLSVARATTRRLYSIYYDTPQLYLHRHAIALRLRRSGRRWLQTLKGGGEVQAGLHRRDEWETPLTEEALDFGALEASGARHLPHAIRNKLRPVFVTDFSRTSRMIEFEGAEIELSLDSGEIRAGESLQPISEIELELKSGRPLQLFRLALALLEVVPLEVETTSKAEYGYRLSDRHKPGIAKAGMPDLTHTPDVAAALQSMAWHCLLHLQANIPGATHRLDDEYLHQVRVALRRLRVVLGMASVFRANDAGLAALRRELAMLCEELGQARDWDVFVTQTLAPMQKRLPAPAQLKPLLRSSERLRHRHHARVREVLQAQSFQRLLLHFGAWMNGDYWQQAQTGAPVAAAAFAAKILRQRSKQVNRLGMRLCNQADGADAGAWHALRIACKKLRYSSELFASLYAGNRMDGYLSALAKLQDILGEMNDIAVARRLLDELDAAAQHQVIALVREQLQLDYMKCIKKFNKGWRNLCAQREFWGQA